MQTYYIFYIYTSWMTTLYCWFDWNCVEPFFISSCTIFTPLLYIFIIYYDNPFLISLIWMGSFCSILNWKWFKPILTAWVRSKVSNTRKTTLSTPIQISLISLQLLISFGFSLYFLSWKRERALLYLSLSPLCPPIYTATDKRDRKSVV